MGLRRFCQRAMRGSGERPCSMKIKRPAGLRRRWTSRRAWETSGMVQRVQVLTMKSKDSASAAI
jgi:hypothetical protein